MTRRALVGRLALATLAALLVVPVSAGAAARKPPKGAVLKVPWPKAGDITVVQARARVRRAARGSARKRLPRLVLQDKRAFKRISPKGLGMYANVRKSKKKGQFLISVVLVSRKPAGAGARSASSHLEAPAILNDPFVGSDDFYFFTPRRESENVLVEVVPLKLVEVAPVGVRIAGSSYLVGGSPLPGFTPGQVIANGLQLAQHDPFTGADEFVGAFGGSIPPGFFGPGSEPGPVYNVVFDPFPGNPFEGIVRMTSGAGAGPFNGVRLRANGGNEWMQCFIDPARGSCVQDRIYITYNYSSPVTDSGAMNARSGNQNFEAWKSTTSVAVSKDGGATWQCAKQPTDTSAFSTCP